MKKVNSTLIKVLIALLTLSSCSENYSNGERIGTITQFSRAGIIFKTWEGHLNVTQTGMNSSVPFDFSVDRDNEDQTVINKVDSAANYGWKVKLTYHRTFGWNWFSNRGDTDYFIKDITIINRNFSNNSNGVNNNDSRISGRTIDTIYVIIDRTVHNPIKQSKESTPVYVGDKY